MCTSACLTVRIKSIRNSHAERFGSASEPTWKADGRQSRPLDGLSLTVHPSRVIEVSVTVHRLLYPHANTRKNQDQLYSLATIRTVRYSSPPNTDLYDQLRLP